MYWVFVGFVLVVFLFVCLFLMGGYFLVMVCFSDKGLKNGTVVMGENKEPWRRPNVCRAEDRCMTKQRCSKNPTLLLRSKISLQNIHSLSVTRNFNTTSKQGVGLPSPAGILPDDLRPGRSMWGLRAEWSREGYEDMGKGSDNSKWEQVTSHPLFQPICKPMSGRKISSRFFWLVGELPWHETN